MSIEIIKQRLLNYKCISVAEQEHALKEIAQEIALMSLARTGFFQVAAFQGGTCLRIIYGLERFSEDLDFVLAKPNKNFTWDNYIANMHKEFMAYGYQLEVINKSNLNKAIRTKFLKTDSYGGMLILKDNRSKKQKLQIKLEIDTNPPHGSSFDLKYLDFPLPYSITLQDLPSLFSGKIHALLCRNYCKGRDWYDFSWYIAKQTKINFLLLTNAINQSGSWQGKNIIITEDWLKQELKTKINAIDWHDIKKDVANFLKPEDIKILDVWSKDFFLSRLDKLINYIQKPSRPLGS